MRKTAGALFNSVIALFLCFAMLLGTTFAWFTDEAVSGNNIIKSGRLDIEMYWTDDLEAGAWNDAEDAAAGAIFNNEKWEPGYTEVRYVKIVNDGSLAFKYGLYITPTSAVSDLGDVIDVYQIDNPTANIDERTALDSLTPAGVLTDVIKGKVTTGGVLLPYGKTQAGLNSGEVIVAIALKMREEAGNEYQDKAIGASFNLTLHATQYGYESDSFSNTYDGSVALPEQDAPAFEVESSASATVNPTAENKVGGTGVTLSGSGIAADVPADVEVEPGTTELTLTVSTLEESASNITLEKDETLTAIDVHIDGISANNSVPMIIRMNGVAPTNLNKGNITLYHVENGSRNWYKN